MFLYGPILVMLVLSLQDSSGRSTFPAKGLISGYWYNYLASNNAAAIRTAAGISLILAIIVGLIASALSLSLIMAYRRMSRRMGRALLYLVLLSLMTPGILLSLGMSLWWKLLGLNVALYPTGLGVQVAWAMPFGFLVMLAIFNRYDIAVEEAARDLGANDDADVHPSDSADHLGRLVFGAALFGFTLSWNEFGATLLVSPTNDAAARDLRRVDLGALQPDLYALGVITTFGNDRAGVPDADHRRADRPPDHATSRRLGAAVKIATNRAPRPHWKQQYQIPAASRQRPRRRAHHGSAMRCRRAPGCPARHQPRRPRPRGTCADLVPVGGRGLPAHARGRRRHLRNLAGRPARDRVRRPGPAAEPRACRPGRGGGLLRDRRAVDRPDLIRDVTERMSSVIWGRTRPRTGADHGRGPHDRDDRPRTG